MESGADVSENLIIFEIFVNLSKNQFLTLIFMQNQFVITIDSNVTPDFALKFLKNVNFIKSIKRQKGNVKVESDIDEVTLISEQTLAEEWLSEEDNLWDKVL
jgi:hypothetical protein